MTQSFTEIQALRAIVGRLEMEVRTAHAFMAMLIMSEGGTMRVGEMVAEQVPSDFEIKITRDNEVATFTVISGQEAAEFRQQQFVEDPIVVEDGKTSSVSEQSEESSE